MEAKVYNTKGKEAGKVTLPEAVFDAAWNGDLVHQVALSMQDNARTPVAHTKDRSEVRGGGKKPWQQKGTGRARHGSSRSPIWIGGGVTFGPRNDKRYDRKINKKMKVAALYSILSQKMRDGEILFVDELKFDAPKTKDAKTAIDSLATVKGFETLATKKKNTALITANEVTENAKQSFANFGNVVLGDVSNVDPVSLLTYKYLIISQPKESIEFLEAKTK